MKIFTKAIFLGLFLGSQAFMVPLERRQSPVTSTLDWVVNGLLGEVLREISTVDTILLDLETFNPPGTLASINGSLSSIASSLENITSIINNSAGGAACALSTSDVTVLISNLGAAQGLVNGIQTTLTLAAASLSSGDVSTITASVQTLETSVKNFIAALQSYATGKLPCVSTVAPSLLGSLQGLLASLSTSIQSLLTQLGVGGVLNVLISTIIP